MYLVLSGWFPKFYLRLFGFVCCLAAGFVVYCFGWLILVCAGVCVCGAVLGCVYLWCVVGVFGIWWVLLWLGLVACWCLGSLIAFWGFCFDLLGCCVNSVVFMVYVCVFVLRLGVLRLIVYCSMLVCVLYGWLVDCAFGILFLVVVLLVLVVGCLYVSYCWLLIVGGCLGCFCGCYYCVGFGFVLFFGGFAGSCDFCCVYGC